MHPSCHEAGRLSAGWRVPSLGVSSGLPAVEKALGGGSWAGAWVTYRGARSHDGTFCLGWLKEPTHRRCGYTIEPTRPPTWPGPVFRTHLLRTTWLASGVLLLFGGAGEDAFGPLSSSPGEAEIRGVVRDTGGGPVTAASVRALEGDRILASAATDGQGRFRLVLPERATDVLRAGELDIQVQRMGYRSERRTLGPEETRVEVRLTPAPLPLPGFQVEGVPEACRADDEDGFGRMLWETAAQRHPGGLDTVGVATYTVARTDTMTLNEAASDEANGSGAEYGQRGSAPILRIGWSRRIDRSGYAFPVRRTDRSGSFQSWSYPPLEADFAPHFGSRQFGGLHYFQFLTEAADGWLIRFCARDEGDPHLEGRMTIAPDTLIHRVEWSVRTAEPDEDAGGYVLFPPVDVSGEPPPLLPLESMAWRTLREEHVIRKTQWFEGWQLAPGDSVPFLPRRIEGEVPQPH